MDQVPLGNKRPRLGMARLVHCPACRGILETPLPLSSGHVLLDCIAVEGISYTLPNIFNCWLGTRIREGIRDFAVDCSNAGRSAASTHYLYVNGMSPVGEPVETKEHMQRGKKPRQPHQNVAFHLGSEWHGLEPSKSSLSTIMWATSWSPW